MVVGRNVDMVRVVLDKAISNIRGLNRNKGWHIANVAKYLICKEIARLRFKQTLFWICKILKYL